MAQDYAKVLAALNTDYICIGRSETSAEKFAEATGHACESGGLDAWIAKGGTLPEMAIVTVSVETLHPVTTALLNAGVKKILLEKPAGINAQEIHDLNDKAQAASAQILVAYNRRFYASVIAAQAMIEEDGGVVSFCYEFTEWPHVIGKLAKPAEVLAAWFLVNSTHVIDLAHFLGGAPEDWNSYSTGSLEWHPSAAVFAGAGRSDKGALFSYHANWGSPGRWWVEILTPKRRLIFRPLEKLQVQELGTVRINFAEIDDQLDQDFKPGLYVQTRNFLNGDFAGMCTIGEHSAKQAFYQSINGGKA